MNIGDSIKTALSSVENLVSGGKLNVTVSSPVVQVKASEAVELAKPYIILALILLTLVVLLMWRKK